MINVNSVEMMPCSSGVVRSVVRSTVVIVEMKRYVVNLCMF